MYYLSCQFCLHFNRGFVCEIAEGTMADSHSQASNCKKKKKSDRTVLKSQTREFVHRLYLYFNKENENKGLLKNPKKVTERVADALQISRHTVYRIMKESRSGQPIVTPGKRRPRQGPKTGLLDESAVRNIIYSYYERKEWPTRLKLLRTLKKANVFHGEKSSLSTILNKLNFEWKKMNKRKLLIEKSDVVSARCTFLQKITLCDSEKVIFLGETCVNVGDSIGKYASRLILIHAGSIHGFVPNCFHLFRSRGTRPFHKELGSDAFKNWFINLLENIPPDSVIVMDNIPLHSVVKEMTPTTAWKNNEIQDYLTKNNIEWSLDMLKGELLELAIIPKPQSVQYELDELAQLMGHTVLRIPPNHYEFNPIELIWTLIKEKVDADNKTFNLHDVEILTKSAIDSVTSDNWEKAVKHTRKIIELAWCKERMVDENMEEMIIKARERPNSKHSDSDSDSNSEDSHEENTEKGNINLKNIFIY